MSGSNYFLLAALPVMGEFGSPPPIAPADLLATVRGADGPAGGIEAILLGDDLLQRQAFLAGEVDKVSPSVLTAEQARNEQPLPDFLSPEAQPGQAPSLDSLWDAYFRWARKVGEKSNSEFLASWVGFEVALRNALATERAKALGLEAEPYLVAGDLGRTDADLETIVSEWISAGDALTGQCVLDRSRWAWLDSHSAWFSFGDDEVMVYAVRLMLLHRWHRMGLET